MAEEADARHVLVTIDEHFHRVAAHAVAARKIAACTRFLLQREQVADELALIDLVARVCRKRSSP